MAAPAKATSGRDMDPISSSCKNNSRNSNGGVTAARRTRQKNIPRSPNHSKNLLIRPREELTMADMSEVDGPGFPVDHGFEPGVGAPCRLFICMRESHECGPL